MKKVCGVVDSESDSLAQKICPTGEASLQAGREDGDERQPPIIVFRLFICLFFINGVFMSKFKLAALALMVVAGTAGAATQGTLGATSTGTFTNSFNSNPAQVQVLNLKDSVMSPTSGNVTFPAGNSIPGVQDNFCVVSTSGGAVNLVFTSTNFVSDPYRTALDAGGTPLPNGYIMSVGTGGSVQAYTGLGTAGFTVPAGVTVTAATACGTGNVTKQIVIAGGSALPAGTAVYTDTVTVVATPV